MTAKQKQVCCQRLDSVSTANYTVSDRTAMDLCRANERNAAALTLTSIGQSPATNSTTAASEQENMTSSGPGAAPVLITTSASDNSARVRSTAGTTWLLVDSNNAEHAGTTVVAQQESGGGNPEHNNNVSTVTVCSPDSWANKQPTVLEDGSIVYADSSDGVVPQSM